MAQGVSQHFLSAQMKGCRLFSSEGEPEEDRNIQDDKAIHTHQQFLTRELSHKQIRVSYLYKTISLNRSRTMLQRLQKRICQKPMSRGTTNGLALQQRCQCGWPKYLQPESSQDPAHSRKSFLRHLRTLHFSMSLMLCKTLVALYALHGKKH